jgi:hypothetical protein
MDNKQSNKTSLFSTVGFLSVIAVGSYAAGSYVSRRYFKHKSYLDIVVNNEDINIDEDKVVDVVNNEDKVVDVVNNEDEVNNDDDEDAIDITPGCSFDKYIGKSRFNLLFTAQLDIDDLINQEISKAYHYIKWMHPDQEEVLKAYDYIEQIQLLLNRNNQQHQSQQDMISNTKKSPEYINDVSSQCNMPIIYQTISESSMDTELNTESSSEDSFEESSDIDTESKNKDNLHSEESVSTYYIQDVESLVQTVDNPVYDKDIVNDHPTMMLAMEDI